MSRVFRNHLGLVLVPQADMFNHAKEPNTSYTFDENFELKADQDIKKGEEILGNYGQRSNHELFFNYGFLEKHNRNNEIYIEAPIFESDNIYQTFL